MWHVPGLCRPRHAPTNGPRGAGRGRPVAARARGRRRCAGARSGSRLRPRTSSPSRCAASATRRTPSARRPATPPRASTSGRRNVPPPSNGGGQMNDVAAVSWGPDRIDLFWVEADRVLWHQAFDGRLARARVPRRHARLAARRDRVGDRPDGGLRGLRRWRALGPLLGRRVVARVGVAGRLARARVPRRPRAPGAPTGWTCSRPARRIDLASLVGRHPVGRVGATPRLSRAPLAPHPAGPICASAAHLRLERAPGAHPCVCRGEARRSRARPAQFRLLDTCCTACSSRLCSGCTILTPEALRARIGVLECVPGARPARCVRTVVGAA